MILISTNLGKKWDDITIVPMQSLRNILCLSVGDNPNVRTRNMSMTRLSVGENASVMKSYPFVRRRKCKRYILGRHYQVCRVQGTGRPVPGRQKWGHRRPQS